MHTPPTTMKQVPIMRRLFDHGRMQRIPLRPPLLVRRVVIDQSGEQRLLRGARVGGRGRVAEFVDGEGERQGGEGDVESFLGEVLGRGRMVG